MMARAALCSRSAWCRGAAAAQPFAPDPKNRVSFAVERTREVANDWITAVVGTSDEDSDAARLADRVNKKMNEALAIAKQAKGVDGEERWLCDAAGLRQGQARSRAGPRARTLTSRARRRGA
jgi:predicted secreted protein